MGTYEVPVPYCLLVSLQIMDKLKYRSQVGDFFNALQEGTFGYANRTIFNKNINALFEDIFSWSF